MPERLAVSAIASTGSVASVASVASAANKPVTTAIQQLELSAIASETGKGVPVDTQHVEDVRRAVRNGTYPITPDTIADRMLALKLNWSPAK
jgi:negative regulator of flagellin synthesis FlgM